MIRALPDEILIEDFIADSEFRAKVVERLAALDRGESVSREEALAASINSTGSNPLVRGRSSRY